MEKTLIQWTKDRAFYILNEWIATRKVNKKYRIESQIRDRYREKIKINSSVCQNNSPLHWKQYPRYG